MKMLHVVCAIIYNDDEILIAQRSDKMALPLKWEFPGGKVERSEEKKMALQREINEELAMEIEVGEALEPVIYHYKSFSITLYPYICNSSSKAFIKREHREIRWEKIENLKKYDWAAADVPVVKKLITEINKM
ncbi:(deoxy)nucleoside triphosphate pyrophosphohydrolase [Gelidibacter maritimus]|nr:(deoxy)nucleoside triphosphate pyrophosphohydrolase [Gelidibacter maritimus]